MKTRRNILRKGAAAATGVTLLSGCTENTSEQQTLNDKPLTIAYDGLGTYEKSLQNAEPVESGKTRAEKYEVTQITSQETVKEEANQLAQVLEEIDTNFYEIDSLMKGYHQEKEDPDNQVILNQNILLPWNEPVHEIYTVENGQLQNQPILQSNASPDAKGTIHKPGQQKPRVLKNLRQFAGQIRTPEHLKTTNMHIEAFEGQREQEELRKNMNHWSECILGLYDSGVPLRPETYDDGMLVYEAKLGDAEPEIYVELCQAVDDEEVLESDVVVEASYDGESWELSQNPDVDIGDFYDEGLTSEVTTR